MSEKLAQYFHRENGWILFSCSWPIQLEPTGGRAATPLLVKPDYLTPNLRKRRLPRARLQSVFISSTCNLLPLGISGSVFGHIRYRRTERPKIYRLRGIQEHVEDNYGLYGVVELLASALGDVDPADVHVIGSLAPTASTRETSKTATVMFLQLPGIVQQAK